MGSGGGKGEGERGEGKRIVLGYDTVYSSFANLEILQYLK